MSFTMNRNARLVQWTAAAGVVMVLLCTLTFTAAQDGEFVVTVITKLGGFTQLNCSSDSFQYIDMPWNNTSPVAWMLPAPGLGRISETDLKYSLGMDNWTLTINNTDVNDLGQYHCMFYNESAPRPWYLVKVALNLRGPYFDVLWDKYETPTIIGICALFGFLLLALVLILIYHFRYIPEPDPDKSSLIASQTSGFGFVKAADVDAEVYEKDLSAPSYENKSYDNKGLDADDMGGSSGVSSAADKDDDATYSEVRKSSGDDEKGMMTSHNDDDGDDLESTTAL